MFPLPMFRSYTSNPTVPYMYSYVPFLAQRLSKNRRLFSGIQSYLSIFTLPQSVRLLTQSSHFMQLNRRRYCERCSVNSSCVECSTTYWRNRNQCDTVKLTCAIEINRYEVTLNCESNIKSLSCKKWT
jgi:hypothetical protein